MYPKNPEEILIKSKFYPKGLREIDCYNYYQKNKSLILKEVRGRDLVLIIMTKPNVPIIKRKINNRYIQLTYTNYDDIIHPRVVTLYSVMKFYEEFFIIDIDTDKFELAKQATLDVYRSMVSSNFVIGLKIRYTGKEGFHIICKTRKGKIDNFRTVAKRYLTQAPELKKYTVEQKPGVVNLDLSPNKLNGAYITNHSLSLWGLICQEMSYDQVKSFNQITAKIKGI